jgi:hypothetical protein
MSKMIVYICVIWISATENNEGLTRCMWHESQVAYQNISECQDDLIHSMERKEGVKSAYNIRTRS